VVRGGRHTGITVNSLFGAYYYIEEVPKQRKPKHTVFAHLPTHTHNNIGLYFINNNNNNKRLCLNNGLQTAATPTAKPFYRYVILYYIYNHITSTLPAGAYIFYDMLTLQSLANNN